MECITSHERPEKTLPENDFFTSVPFCLRLFMRFERCGAHYFSYTKISQTKCYKQSDTIFQFSFHCSFRCCAPFCSLCCPLRPLLLIGGKLSTANQDPPKEWFKSETQRAKRSSPSERAMKTELKSDVRLFVAFCLTYVCV